MFKGLRMRLLINIVIIVVAMSVTNLGINAILYQYQANKEMREKASTVAEQFISMRKFISSVQDTINYARNKEVYEFKQLNPAVVGREVGTIFKERTNYSIKQTRLKPRVAANAPDQFEIDAMQKMDVDRTITEYYDYDVVDGKKVYRYIVPLYFEQSCLDCHGTPQGDTDVSGYPKEGGKVNDFAGAISIMFPAEEIARDVGYSILIQGLFLLLILLITFVVLYVTMGKIIVTPLKQLTEHVDKLGSMAWEDSLTDADNAVDEMKHLGLAFNAMSEKLQSSYVNLEERVEDRTRMLREANTQLQEKSDELLRINALLSDSDRMKSELMASISGGLRDPLSSIIAFCQAMLANPDSLKDHDKFLKDILWNAQELDDQITDLMAMSQIEAGLMGLDYVEFRFEDIIQDLRRTMNPIFARKNLKLNVDIATTTPSAIADLDKMKHVMRNLLCNSLKYTPEGGWVRVRIEPLPMAGDGMEMILIQVSDSGIGIKPEDLPHIFTKMWHGQKTGRGEKGGLGLAIAKIFIELHGGSVDVKSIWQKGTLFSIKLPRQPEEF